VQVVFCCCSHLHSAANTVWGVLSALDGDTRLAVTLPVSKSRVMAVHQSSCTMHK
jgi:hypothetical protein